MCQPMWWTPDRFIDRINGDYCNPRVSEREIDSHSTVATVPVKSKIQFNPALKLDMVMIWADLKSLYSGQWGQHEGWIRENLKHHRSILIFPYAGRSYPLQIVQRLEALFPGVAWHCPDIGEFKRHPLHSPDDTIELVNRLITAGAIF